MKSHLFVVCSFVIALPGIAAGAEISSSNNDPVVLPNKTYAYADVEKASKSDQCAMILKGETWKPGDPPMKKVQEGDPNPINWPWHKKQKTECDHAGRPTSAVLATPPSSK